MFFLNRQIFKNVIIFYLVIIMLKEIDKLIITSNENIENELFELFCSNLIKAFNEIKDWFNVQYSSLSLTLVSKSELNKIAKEKSESYKNADVPDWLVGFSNFEQIWIVTPTLETLEEMIKVALHELIHLISYKLDTSNITKSGTVYAQYTSIIWNFSATGGEQTFISPITRRLRLETWGAGGGGIRAGYGGYSTGYVSLNEGNTLYINIGTQGVLYSGRYGGAGGYNGGGAGGATYSSVYTGGSGGGGATHIATKSGLLSSLEDYKDSILIVSGGGGGASSWHSSGTNLGGYGGGFKGGNPLSKFSSERTIELGSTQTEGYAFGQGMDAPIKTNYGTEGAEGNGGGGGGFIVHLVDAVHAHGCKAFYGARIVHGPYVHQQPFFVGPAHKILIHHRADGMDRVRADIFYNGKRIRHKGAGPVIDGGVQKARAAAGIQLFYFL